MKGLFRAHKDCRLFQARETKEIRTKSEANGVSNYLCNQYLCNYYCIIHIIICEDFLQMTIKIFSQKFNQKTSLMRLRNYYPFQAIKINETMENME